MPLPLFELLNEQSLEILTKDACIKIYDHISFLANIEEVISEITI